MDVTSVGVAAPGWPASGGAVAGRNLHLVSRNLPGTRVATLDVRGLVLRRQRAIPAGEGAWGVAATANQVVVGLFGARGRANLHRLGSGTPQPLAAIDVEYVWDLAIGPGGVVYGVGGPPDLAFAYDPATRQARALGVVEPGTGVRTCAVTGSRLVVGGVRGGGAVLRAATLEGAGARPVLPPSLARHDIVYACAALPGGRVAAGTTGPSKTGPAVVVLDPDAPGDALVVTLRSESTVDAIAADGDHVLLTARPSGALYRLDPRDGDVERVAVPVAQSETRVVAVADGAVVGVSADGSAWRRDPDGRTTVRSPAQLGLGLAPQRPQVIAAGPGRVDVGGSFTCTRHELAAGATRPTRTRRVPGEPKAAVVVDGTTHMAVYPVGEVWSWRATSDAPRRTARLPAGQGRPIGMAAVPRLDLLAVTSTDDRGTGALSLVDPVTGRVDAVPVPLDGQTPAGVLASGRTLYVGGSGPRPVVVALDVPSLEVRWRVAGVAPDGFVLGLAVVDGRLVTTTSSGWAAVVDLGTRAVAPPRRVAEQAGALRRRGTQLLLATGDAVLALDPRTGAATRLLDRLDGEVWGWPPLDVGPDGRAWAIRGRDLVHTPPLT